MRAWIKALPLGLGLPLMIGAASVKPEDAASNVAAWLHLFGVANVPNWLASPNADKQVICWSIVAAVIYVCLVWGPALYWRRIAQSKLQTTSPSVIKSDIRLELRGAGYEWGLFDADDGHKLPIAIGFSARITNEGDKLLRKCQITFGEKERFNYPVSGYFDLRPGEYRNVIILRINLEGKFRRPFVYMQIAEDGKIFSSAGSWMPDQDGIYEIRALSADTHLASLAVQLTQVDGKWDLTECS